MRIDILGVAPLLDSSIIPRPVVICVLLPRAKVTPVKRNDWLGFSVTAIIPTPEPVLGVSSRMIVPSLIVGLPAGPEIVVAPCIVIPLVIFSRAVQLNVPAG